MQGQRPDFLAGVLAALGFGGIVFALIQSEGEAGAVGAIALIALFYWERRAPSPMIPLHLFRSRNFTGANVLTLLLYSALGGVLFFFPLDLKQVQGYSPTEAGAALLPLILLLSLLSRWSGGLVDRYGAKPALMVGPLVAAAGFALFRGPVSAVLIGPPSSPQSSCWGSIMRSRVLPVYGGRSFRSFAERVFQISLDRRLDTLSVAPEERVQIEAQRSKLAAAETQDQGVRQAINEAFVAGYHRVLWMATGLALASSLSAAMLIQSDRRQVHD
jgi:hypothetical protein